MARPISLTVIALAALSSGCEEPALSPDAGTDAAEAEPQGSLARGELVINEVAPRPGDGPDWIELFNRSDRTLDLCGFLITDALDRLDHYSPLAGALPPDPCEPAPLAPGAYVLVLADDGVAPGHARFRLGEADEVHVVTIDGQVMDSLVYLYPVDGAGASLARQPDGEGLFHVEAPTPGAANPLAQEL